MDSFNPLDKRNLGESVARAILAQPVHAIPPNPFDGAGIYALYYTGSFSLYQKLAERNRNNRFAAPIYVGKADPKGGRKGAGLDVPHKRELLKRLKDHAKSIREVENLNLEDFYFRYLAVDDVWIKLGETLLIEMTKPVWNIILDGFGNHAPGGGREESQKPFWDTIHPGRPWAMTSYSHFLA